MKTAVFVRKTANKKTYIGTVRKLGTLLVPVSSCRGIPDQLAQYLYPSLSVA